MSKIMVIDDTEDTVELAKTILEISGFEVSAYTSPETALAELKKGNLPDLVILDVRMPGISGPEVCEQIRKDEKLKDLKIIFFTASGETNIELLKKHGVLGYIFKPFDNDEFVKNIKNYLAR